MIVILVAIILYAVTIGLLADWIPIPSRSSRVMALCMGFGAVLAHGVYHIQVAWMMGGRADMHFFAALSLISLGMAFLTLLYGDRQRVAALGIVVLPLAASLLVLYHWHGHTPSPYLGWPLLCHAWLALLAYATLSIAALLALMLFVQERSLRRHTVRQWLRVLPPMTELESLLFRTIAIGFVCLTLTLLSGLIFVEDLFAQQLLHKTVLSFLSWLVFGALLLGRWHYGWRGIKAVHLTLLAMMLLVLAYFGSKLVLAQWDMPTRLTSTRPPFGPLASTTVDGDVKSPA